MCSQKRKPSYRRGLPVDNWGIRRLHNLSLYPISSNHLLTFDHTSFLFSIHLLVISAYLPFYSLFGSSFIVLTSPQPNLCLPFTPSISPPLYFFPPSLLNIAKCPSPLPSPSPPPPLTFRSWQKTKYGYFYFSGALISIPEIISNGQCSPPVRKSGQRRFTFIWIKLHLMKEWNFCCKTRWLTPVGGSGRPSYTSAFK